MKEADLDTLVTRMHMASIPGFLGAEVESYDPPVIVAEFDSHESAYNWQFQTNEGGGRAAFAPGSQTTLHIFK